MSRGLGKVEKKILEYFNMSKRDKAEIPGLCYYVAGLIGYPSEDWPFNEDYSDSIYKSVYRSVKSLERKGYLKTERVNPNLLTRERSHDWTTRILKVSLAKR